MFFFYRLFLHYFKIEINEISLSLYFVIKNITASGWINKPKIKRIQIRNIKNDNPDFAIHNDNNSFNLILGYYNYDENPIFVGWDAYRYYNHNTLRSCYVSVDSLKRGYVKKYYDGIDSSQKIWIFIPKNFAMFLNNYIDYVGKELNKNE